MDVTPLGPIMQVAFIVDDLEAAARHWARTMGVGPFFALEHISYADCEYEGQPLDLDISVAFAYSGDIQIELVQQHSPSASVFRSAEGRFPTGLHHFGIVTSDPQQDENRLREAGFRKVQWARSPGGGGVSYFEGSAPGFVELIELSAGGPAFFAQLKEVSRVWDRQSVFVNK